MKSGGATLLFEVWIDPDEKGNDLEALIEAGPRGDAARASFGPHARLIATFEAGNRVEAMTIYHRMCDRGVYVPDCERDHEPYRPDQIAPQEPLRRRLREAFVVSGHYPRFEEAAMRGEPAPIAAAEPYTIRHTIRPGDIGTIVQLHGILYDREYGFDATFEAYVAGPLGAFVLSGCERGRIWLAEREGGLIGCIAIVPETDTEARLRWFLVDPSARGLGLGRRLLSDAIAFCREEGYASVVLSTVGALATAGMLYRRAGFQLVSSEPMRIWGTDVKEEVYTMRL